MSTAGTNAALDIARRVLAAEITNQRAGVATGVTVTTNGGALTEEEVQRKMQQAQQQLNGCGDLPTAYSNTSCSYASTSHGGVPMGRAVLAAAETAEKEDAFRPSPEALRSVALRRAPPPATERDTRPMLDSAPRPVRTLVAGPETQWSVLSAVGVRHPSATRWPPRPRRNAINAAAAAPPPRRPSPTPRPCGAATCFPACRPTAPIIATSWTLVDRCYPDRRGSLRGHHILHGPRCRSRRRHFLPGDDIADIDAGPRPARRRHPLLKQLPDGRRRAQPARARDNIPGPPTLLGELRPLRLQRGGVSARADRPQHRPYPSPYPQTRPRP